MLPLRRSSAVNSVEREKVGGKKLRDKIGQFVCLVSLHPRQQRGYLADGSQDRCLTILCTASQRQSGETMTSVSAGLIIVYTDTDPTSRE